MNDFTEQIREHAVSELEASERQAYVLAHETDKALRAAYEAIAQLTRLTAKIGGGEGAGPDEALAALRTLAGHAGYSNSITTAVNEVTAAAGAVAGILSTL